MKLTKPEWLTLNKDSFHLKNILYVLGISVFILFSISLLWVYAFPGLFGSRLEPLRERMPYPLLVLAPYEIVTYREYSDNAIASRRFYESQDFSKLGLRLDLSTPEGEKRFLVRKKEILNKLAEDTAIKEIARQNNIKVTRSLADEGVKRALNENDSEQQVARDLEKLYGWEMDQFEEKVVMPSLYQEKIQALFESQVSKTEAEEKIMTAKKELNEGALFPAIAEKYSEGETSKQGGEMGWFKINDLAPELQKEVAKQIAGVPGEVIESSLGYHIVLVEEMKQEGENTLYRLRQIFVEKVLFTDWLTDKMKEMSFVLLSPEYIWNKEKALVDFKNKEMQDFEENLYQNTEGDVFFLF